MSFPEVCEEKMIRWDPSGKSISFPEKKSLIILRKKMKTLDFAQQISDSSRRMKFLIIVIFMKLKPCTFLWCFYFFSKLLVDTRKMAFTRPNSFYKQRHGCPSQKMGRVWAIAQLLAWGIFEEEECIKKENWVVGMGEAPFLASTAAEKAQKYGFKFLQAWKCSKKYEFNFLESLKNSKNMDLFFEN